LAFYTPFFIDSPLICLFFLVAAPYIFSTLADLTFAMAIAVIINMVLCRPGKTDSGGPLADQKSFT
jgi:hypothetical protein